MAKSILDTLREVRDGDLIAELTARMAELVEAVRATDRKGTLTVRFTLIPSKKGVPNMLFLEDDVKLVLPEPDRESTTVVFATDDNSLSRRDPRQPDLPGVRGVVKEMPAPAERIDQSHG